MELRRASAKDAPAISRLESEIFPDPWTYDDIVGTISSEGSMCYVAYDGDDLVSYMVARQIPPEGEIYRIATSPKKRRHGVGYRLLDYAVKSERGRGLESLFLEVRESNIPAKNLYHSYGFREVGVRKNYYRNPTENAVIMLLSHEEY